MRIIRVEMANERFGGKDKMRFGVGSLGFSWTKCTEIFLLKGRGPFVSIR